MSHECVIGLLHYCEDSELATVSKVKENIADRARSNRQMRELGVETNWLYKKEWSLRDYADRRKTTDLKRFSYCPECGKKIDWGAIRKEG